MDHEKLLSSIVKNNCLLLNREFKILFVIISEMFKKVSLVYLGLFMKGGRRENIDMEVRDSYKNKWEKEYSVPGFIYFKLFLRLFLSCINVKSRYNFKFH